MSSGAGFPDGPPRHLERFAPPWASDRRTVCGRQLDDVAEWVSLEEGRRMVAKFGRMRASLLFCQTCLSQQGRVKSPDAWVANPVLVVNDYTAHHWPHSAGFAQTRAELLALARLVEEHPDEFRAAVAAFAVDELEARRRRRS